jgi:nitrate/nitrite transporter NarK
MVSLEIWYLILIYSNVFGSIHAFYPNMSKFLRNNYGFSNIHAGHLSSIPYIVGSLTVPIFG